MRKYFWAFAVVALFCACSGKNAKKQGADAASDEALVEMSVKPRRDVCEICYRL